jgi:ABC-type antimicrobial peptide transport system permease subunit
MWKLRKRVAPKDGETLDYTDERGRPFRIRLVAALPTRLSVFQGRLLVSNRDFTRLFPSESGHRVFVADVPAGREVRVAAYLTQRLEAAGLDWVPAVARLREFYVVESTYLAMFLVLGGLGVLLGSVGLGVLVLRTVMERRGELALLRAVGYSEGQTRGVVMAEHRFLVAVGLAAGLASAALAIAPSAARPEVHVPYGLLAAFLAGTAIISLAWIQIATGLALRGPVVPALRSE